MFTDRIPRWRNRVAFTTLVAAGALGWALAGARTQPAEPEPDSKPTGADLGSLFPEVQKLAQAQPFAYSFLGDRFRTLGDFQAAGRDKILELLHHRPDKVDPKPQILER